MTDKPNFVLVPEDPPSPPQRSGVLARLRTMTTSAVSAAASASAALRSLLTDAEPPDESGVPTRPRLVFAVDATASREPAWEAARRATDALVKALPGELDVALAAHGGSRVHTFTAFTGEVAMLRDRAAGVTCQAGLTRLLPIMSAALRRPLVRVLVYVGDVFEESLVQGRSLADEMGAKGVKLIVLHDTADPSSRRDAEVFWDLARRTGGCVLPFDANASGRLRDILSAVAVYAVGGEKLLREHRQDLPGATALLENLGTHARRVG
jgi:hypothetical protein